MTKARIKNESCVVEGLPLTADQAVELRRFRGTCHECGGSVRVRRTFTTSTDFEVPAHFRHYPVNHECRLSGPGRVR
jgi:hypothetical protein